jgi:hypothetical protein
MSIYTAVQKERAFFRNKRAMYLLTISKFRMHLGIIHDFPCPLLQSGIVVQHHIGAPNRVHGECRDCTWRSFNMVIFTTLLHISLCHCSWSLLWFSNLDIPNFLLVQGTVASHWCIISYCFLVAAYELIKYCGFYLWNLQP